MNVYTVCDLQRYQWFTIWHSYCFSKAETVVQGSYVKKQLLLKAFVPPIFYPIVTLCQGEWLTADGRFEHLSSAPRQMAARYAEI